MRGWGHGQIQQVFSGGSGPGGADAVDASQHSEHLVALAKSAFVASKTRGEIEDWTLYTHYLWWLLWGFFLLPLPGTGIITLIALLLGAPVASDVGESSAFWSAIC